VVVKGTYASVGKAVSIFPQNEFPAGMHIQRDRDLMYKSGSMEGLYVGTVAINGNLLHSSCPFVASEFI
jgi:hypothetical protein